MSNPDIDIETLTSNFNNLLVETPQNTMAITYNITKEDYGHLMSYDGNPTDLIFFVNTVKEIYNNTCSNDNTLRIPNHARLLTIVKSKLVDQARDCLLTNTFNNVHELLDYLTQTFKDSRTIEQLKRELMRTFPYRNEFPTDFINRIAKLRSLIFSRIHIDEEIADKRTLMDYQDREINNHILVNLHPQLSDFLAHMTLKNIENIRNAIQNDCSHIIERLYNHNNRGNDRKRNETKPIETKRYKNYNNDRRDYNNYRNYNERRDYNNYRDYNYQREYNNYRDYNDRRDFYRNDNRQNRPDYKSYEEKRYDSRPEQRVWHHRNHWQQNDKTKEQFPSQPFNPNSQNTVSMRTVRSNNQQLHHVEPTEGTSQIQEQVDQLTKRFEHFLEPEQPDEAPNIH